MLQCHPRLLVVSSLKKKSYWVVHMPNECIMSPLLPGYNMDVLSKFLSFIVFIPLIVDLVKFYLWQKNTFKQQVLFTTC